jgi:hypothetical protein
MMIGLVSNTLAFRSNEYRLLVVQKEVGNQRDNELLHLLND